MGFDVEGFSSAKATARTMDVPVADLRDWFGPEDAAVWRVRGLTANELVRADAAKESMKREGALVDALAAGSRGDIVRNLQAMLGRGDDVEPDMARRVEILRAGSLEPECTTQLAVRLAEHFPVVFFQLSNAILTLTGQGSDVEKKPRPSGETPASEPPPP
jgi:hypothetical protein